MALATFNPLYSYKPSSKKNPPIYTSLSTSQFSRSRTLTIPSLKSVSNLGLTPFSSWNGLRKNGFSISLHSLKLERRKKWKGKGVFASLFGVGAPEALVIGVVALLVFGPKGLADVAKNLGKTLRAFQPTIRELQEVSRDFKSTLEKEIGLDELKNPLQEENYTSNTVRGPPASRQVPPELPATPPETTTTETVTTPADSSEDPQETTTTPPSVSLDETTVTPAATMDDSMSADNTSTNERVVYSSEDLLKITEEQLKALASRQQKEQTTSPTPSEKPEGEI